MNKKLKRMLAVVSAVAMCTVSAVSTYASAMALNCDRKVTSDTISFVSSEDDVSAKYNYSQELTDYFGIEDKRFFISEPLIYEDNHNIDFYEKYLGKEYRQCMMFEYQGPNHSHPEVVTFVLDGYGVYNKDLPAFEEYLKENNLAYKVEAGNEDLEVENGCSNEECSTVYVSEIYSLDDEGNMTPFKMWVYDAMPLLIKIKEDTGYVCQFITNENEASATDIVNELPEPTLSGDTDCDDKVNINDAVFVMQSIANPDKYKISEQGKVNADIDGNGITLSDAIAIQEMAASHLYD